MKILTFATLLAAGPAIADIGGDPVTAETLVDRMEMIRIADAIDAAVDAKDWPAARRFFADEIDVDFTSLAGGAPVTIPADNLISGWASTLTAEKTSFHLRGNHAIAFDGPDNAVTTSHGYAWNQMASGGLPENGGETLWEVWGRYTHAFSRSDAGWHVTAMAFTATAERGSAYVRNTPGG